MQYQRLIDFSYKQNADHLHRSIYYGEFSKQTNFHRNVLQTHGNTEPQTCQVLQRNAGGKRLPPSMHFFVKIASLDVAFF